MTTDLLLDTADVVLDSEHPPQPQPGPQLAPTNGDGGGPLYFDLETVPDESRLATFGLEPVLPVPDETEPGKLPDVAQVVTGTVETIKATLARYVCPAAWLDSLTAAEQSGKNRAGVHSLIDSARCVRLNALAAHVERRKLLSTTPEFCRIAAIGWTVGRDPVVHSTLVGDAPGDEARALESLWGLIGRHSPIVGFNCLAFDLPVLLVRSALLGVAPPKMLDLRTWGKDVVDLYLLRFGGRGNNDRQRPGKLKSLAPLYGIDVPAGDVDGSQVEELARANPQKLAEYVRSDVEVLRQFHRRLAGYFWT